MKSQAAARIRGVIIAKAAQFSRREDGTVTIFGILMFVLMVTIGGIAIDIMRYETQRAQLQYTLDRAILAAASLDQTLDPEAVVRDYFARAGLDENLYRLNITVTENLNVRTVSASAEMDVETMFMDMFGVRALTTPSFGEAEERIPNVEISMVLDVSGSMAWYSSNGQTKMSNLQTAANEFISTVMAANDYATDDMTVSVSVVPYHGYVNAGSTIDSVFNISNFHTNATCTRFRTAQFNTTGLLPAETIDRLAHFDYRNRNSYSFFRSPYCPAGDQNAILPWSSSITELQTTINSFSAGGWTAIDQGMRWGVTLLDPSSGDELQALGTTVHEDFATRPAAYDDDTTLKVILLMTDGENTEQWDVNDAFRAGGSGIYYHEADDRWSMYMPATDTYWVPYPRAYDSTTFNNPYGEWLTEPYRGADGSESVQYSWPWMWANFTRYAIARGFYYWPSYWAGEWDYYHNLNDNGLVLFSGTNTTGMEHVQADANLRAICDAANDAGIVVFTVAFEAPARGQEVMEHCASTPAHYYDVEGVEISEAFGSIATTINNLRLTQ